MITNLGFCLFILYFYLKVLINHLFLFKIFYSIFKKLFRFLFESYFKIWFKKRFFCLVSSIVFIFSGFKNIKNKRTLKYIQYLRKNVIKSFIILSKIPCIFIYRCSKIIEYYSNFVMSKDVGLLVQFFIDNIR